MGFIERAGDLHADLEDLIEGQAPALQPVGERFAFEVFHHQVMGAVLMADVVQGADIRIVQTGDGARLNLEPLATFGAARQLCGQDLDSDGAVQAGIAGAVDFAHTAGADGRKDLVRP